MLNRQNRLNMPDGSAEPLWLCVAKALPLVLAVSLITTYAHQVGWLRGLETTALDTLLTLNPLRADHVFVVGIGNEDYKTFFSGRSPLNPGKLSQLISAIEAGEPRVIVVDLDTSDPVFVGIRLPPSTSTIVWGRPAIRAEPANERGRAGIAVSAHSHDRPSASALMSGAVLGKTGNGADVLSGIALLPEDSDGIVRHYCRRIPVRNGNTGIASGQASAMDSLPWAAVKSFRKSNQAGQPPEDGSEVPGEQLVLSFAGGSQYVPQMSAGDLLAIHSTPGWKNLVNGKIVLLGGYFDSARDSYVTPVGRMTGVELLAQAIETELQRGGVHPVSQAFLLAVQIAASCLLVGLNCRLQKSWIPGAGIIAIPVAALLLSLVSFSSCALWIDFVPVLFAVQLHFLFEHIENVRKQNIALVQVNEELSRTRHDLAQAVNRGAESERKRLAQELHDDTLGHLSQVSVSLTSLAKDTPDGGTAGRALSTVREAMQNIRQIMMNLYPPVLEKYGFMNAVQELVNGLRTPSLGVEVIDDSERLSDRLGKDTQLALYRIVQQALNNMQKHAEASKCLVSFKSEDGQLLVSVVDNGKGSQQPADRPDSYGLESMRNKALLIGAEISWISPPRQFSSGTAVLVKLPIGQDLQKGAN